LDYAVKAFYDAGGTRLTGLQALADVATVQVWGTPPAGNN